MPQIGGLGSILNPWPSIGSGGAEPASDRIQTAVDQYFRPIQTPSGNTLDVFA